MTSVKIIGAGSIGNHLANAARSKDWDVTLCDIDPAALERTRTSIYPSRYGEWDAAIRLSTVADAPRGEFDWIFIGTPPDVHMMLALDALEERPKGILIEKPLATPDLAHCQSVFERCGELGVRAFVGYDHVVSQSAERFCALARTVDNVKTLDVSFREHWQGIFNAHPWLSGPPDTYLGYWARGGGACGEHSHALNLWQNFSHVIGAGRVSKVSAMMDYVENGDAKYDQLALLNLETESGLVGRVVQDVVTQPALKWARLQGGDTAIEWQCNAAPYLDVVRVEGAVPSEDVFDKTRPLDFIQELDHLEAAVASGAASPIDLARGLDSMLVIAAAHMSAQRGCNVAINYNAGYCSDALHPVQ
jgi:predicted dehydrogenase